MTDDRSVFVCGLEIDLPKDQDDVLDAEDFNARVRKQLTDVCEVMQNSRLDVAGQTLQALLASCPPLGAEVKRIGAALLIEKYQITLM